MTKEQLRTSAGFPGVIPGPFVEPSGQLSTYTLTAMIGGFALSEGTTSEEVATIGAGCVVAMSVYYMGPVESLLTYPGATTSDVYFPGAKALQEFC